MAEKRNPSALDKYRAKRKVEATPEPFGGSESERPYLFVVQKHAARRTHYDLRLEWRGTLVSWAVPQGPSPNPSEKRLAVHVEDHPVEYADFEGIIPAGNYGAGAVIVWDQGRWRPLTDPDRLSADGKLHLEFFGYKLRGEWILVRTKRGEKDWLLFKKQDEWAREKPEWGDESVFSGLTVEELGSGSTRAAEITAELEGAKATRRVVDPMKLELMLAETADEPFSSPDWIFELKYDGYRLVAGRALDGTVKLRYRNGMDVTAFFPEIAKAVRALPYGLVLDGEVVVLDDQGHPSFPRLQARGQIRKPRDADRAAVDDPATLFVFDMLGFGDFDLRGLPLLTRKTLLARVLPRAGALRYSDHVPARGKQLFEQVKSRGLEGLIAKRATSPYRSGRSGDWLKLPAEKTGDFVICGYTRGKGTRNALGALHVGAYAGGTLRYAGRIGTGMDERTLSQLAAELSAIERPTPPCEGAMPKGSEHVWVEPQMVVEARYKTWTEDGLLRHSVFVRIRDDKRPEECLDPRGEAAAKSAAAPESVGQDAPKRRPDPPAKAKPKPAEAPREVSFTNLKKVFWPAEGYTKGDLIEYYRAIAPWLMPYLEDRPVVLTRYPDGIEGKSFYQKDAPVFTPEWIRTEPIWHEDAGKENRYIVVENLEALLFLANLGTIPIHVWLSRVATLQQPDWCVLDLDPKGAPFDHVVELALAVRDLCEKIGLPAYAKTSGSTGIHVLIPLARQVTYEQSRMLGNLIARVVHDDHKEISSIARMIGKRGGKVYLDFLQNRHSQLLVAPYSVRPLPGAPVSMPLRWSEVNRKLKIGDHTIRTAVKRMEKLGEDPFRPVLTEKPKLKQALAKLATRIDSKESE